MTSSMRIGVISDTHMPRRWKRLPEVIFTLFEGVDLVVHAGDVGELWVLDELSRIAPVVAVHGNDETQAAQKALPFLQTMVIAGRRIVITHGNLLNWELEMARRREDNWATKLNDVVEAATPHGAEIAIFGHLHIPLWANYRGLWILNPGAIASGGYFHRQALQTVALLTLTPGQEPQAQHFNLAAPDQPFQPRSDWEAGFDSFWNQCCTPIFTPEVMAQIPWMRETLLPLILDTPVEDIVLNIMHQGWAGERPLIDVSDVVQALRQYPDTPPAVFEVLRSSGVFGRYV